MSRPNLARLEPSAYTVLSVADPEKVVTTTGQVLGDLDLDHLCRLLIRSERSLSLVNRRSFAAALADVPALPNQALRPAPPFAEAVASAREDGKLLERTRQFLAQNPRALEELTPELTLALLRHFDPSMRMRPSPFTRHVVAVCGVTVIALTAATLGIIHTQQNDAITARATDAQIAQIEREQHAGSPASRSVATPPHALTRVAVVQPEAPPVEAPAPLIPAAKAPSAVSHVAAAAPVSAPVFHRYAPAPISRPEVASVEPTVTKKRDASLFVDSTAGKQSAAAAAAGIASGQSAGAEPVASLPQSKTVSADGAAVIPAASGSSALTQASPAASASGSPLNSSAATSLVLRTIVSQNPNANVEWIRANKSSDHVVTVTTRVHNNNAVSEETYRLYNSDGQLTVIDHHTATPAQ